MTDSSDRDILSPNRLEGQPEAVLERALRPQALADFMGQPELKEKLSVFIEAARGRAEAMDHTLFHGHPGLGKTTLAQILSLELGVGFKNTSGPVIERPGDLAALLTNLSSGDILFIDEIHRLSPVVEEILYPAMEDFKLDLMIGQGPGARSVRLDLPPFTLVGATTRVGLLTPPLRDRFGIQLRLDYYRPEELALIVTRAAALSGARLTPEGALELARRSRGTPRIAGRLLRRVRDYAEVRADGLITEAVADAALKMLGVDALGLDQLDRRILFTICDKFGGGPVGLETLATTVGEEAETILEVYEPYLIQEGFVHRTPRGRVVTARAYRHLGLVPPHSPSREEAPLFPVTDEEEETDAAGPDTGRPGKSCEAGEERGQAYIARFAPDKRPQPLVDHLTETARYAKLLGGKFNVPYFTYVAAIVHDMGKCSAAFSNYLKLNLAGEMPGGKSSPKGSVIHSTQGAKYIYEKGLDEKELLLPAEMAAICVAGHHGGLMDGISLSGEAPLLSRLTRENSALHYQEVAEAFKKAGLLDADLKDLLKACRNELNGFIGLCETEHISVPFMLHMLVKSIFSCLVDADRYNAYCFDAETTPESSLTTPPWSEYAGRLEAYLSAFEDDSEIAAIRRDISQKCFDAFERPRGVYRLDVPTGGGKTLSSLRFALNHAAKHDMDRVIYVIPYLSVLEQTAKEIKKALSYSDDEDFILEHHSNLMPPEDESEAQARRLLTDRWSQPIVITTLVQFLESIYSSKSSNLRKLHNMANAVFIFDEVQSLPVKCVHLFNDALNYLHAFGRASALLCTATQPLIDRIDRPVRLSSPPELISDTREAFLKFKRTRIVDSTRRLGYTLDEMREFVLEKLSAAGNGLVILNTKKEAANLYRSVEKHINENPDLRIKLVHLSTAMCPAHRLEVIDSLQESDGNKRRLKRGRILCLSTQLIEAGVDISFGCVIRACAGLDSIAQAAGRCNRNGENPDGRDVYIVNLADEDLTMLPDIKCGSDIVRNMLGESAEDLLSRDIMERYYQKYFYKRRNEMDYLIDSKRTSTIYDLLACNKIGYGAYKDDRRNSGRTPPELRQAFQTAGEKFCVIERNTTAVLVPYGRGAELAEAYRAAGLKEKPRLLREMGRYSVSLHQKQLEALKAKQALRMIDDGLLVLSEDYYHAELGVDL